MQSETGKGSAFTFELPQKPVVNEAKKVTTEKPSVKSPEKLKKTEGVRILIVEDDLSNFMYIEELMYRDDITTYHAKNGIEAIKSCSETLPHLVLMDLRMPVLDGFEATRKIKDLNPELPIIAVSAHALPEEIEKARKAGCDDFITKPIDVEALRKAINKYI